MEFKLEVQATFTGLRCLGGVSPAFSLFYFILCLFITFPYDRIFYHTSKGCAGSCENNTCIQHLQYQYMVMFFHEGKDLASSTEDTILSYEGDTQFRNEQDTYVGGL